MGFLSRKKSIDQLEEENDRLKIEEEIATKKSAIEERKAVVARLKAEHGHDWMKILGLKGSEDTNTLKSFLTGAKSGMKSWKTPRLNPLGQGHLGRRPEPSQPQQSIGSRL